MSEEMTLPCNYSVSSFLRDWDSSTAQRRVRILRQFIANSQYKTGIDLEQQFAGAASLFFTRLTAWIRITYLSGKYLSDQLRAINLFLSSTASQTYLREFLEVGGVQTLLELISVKQAKEVDKTEAIKVLYSVADSGRKYKEHICECYGVRAVAECMVRSSSEQTCEVARRLLYCLAIANPRFTVAVYKGLVALFSCDLPVVQRMAAMTVRRLQSTIGSVIFNVLDPLYDLLKSLNVEVQVEACELVLELINYDDKDELLRGLVQLLQPSADEVQRAKFNIMQDELSQSQPHLSVYVQQAAAARCVGKLVVKCTTLINKLIALGAVDKLLCAIANTEYIPSQREAAVALSNLCHSADESQQINERLITTVGPYLHQLILNEPEDMYTKLTVTHIDILSAGPRSIELDQDNFGEILQSPTYSKSISYSSDNNLE